MEIVLFLCAVAFVWWLVKRKGSHEAVETAHAVSRARRHELAELSCWTMNVEDETGILTVAIDFPKMWMGTRFEARSGYSDYATEYTVRRRDSGWQMRLTERGRRAEVSRVAEPFTAEIERLSKDRTVKNMEAQNALMLRMAQLMKDDQPWEPIAEELEPQIETAYQRYIHAR